MKYIRISCPKCHGQGYQAEVRMPETECRTCSGSGEVQVEDKRTPVDKLLDRIRSRTTGRDNDEITLDAKEMKLILKRLK